MPTRTAAQNACLSWAGTKMQQKKIMLDYLAEHLKASGGISCSPRRTLSPVRSRALKVRIGLKIHIYVVTRRTSVLKLQKYS